MLLFEKNQKKKQFLSRIKENLLTQAIWGDTIAKRRLESAYGEMPERLKGLVLKTSDSERNRGFESHSLRYELIGLDIVVPELLDNIDSNLTEYKQHPWRITQVAEGAPLERE